MIPTMSKSALLLECQWWAQSNLAKPEEAFNEKTAYGIDFHAVMAGADCTDEALVARAQQAKGVLDEWLEANGYDAPLFRKIEQAFGWRVLDMKPSAYFEAAPPDGVTHVYPNAAPDIFHGQSDLVVMSDTRRLLIEDHKTGDDDFSKPDSLAQLWSLGAVAERLYNPVDVQFAVLHAPHSGGVPTVYASAPISLKRFRKYRNMIRRAWRRIGDGSLRPGEHCTGLYCPAYAACPLRDEAADKLLELRRKPSTAITSAQDAARVYTAGKDMVKIWEDRVLPEVRRFVEENGDIELDDGKTLRIVENSPRDNLSQASIKRALGAAKGVQEIERLRKLGCIETTTPKPSLIAR